jgi:catechol 2,3-dioxygenase-like lactoylglutathione lyase family enzyme
MTRQSLAHIALVVRDYDEAIDFYVGTLGFTLVADDYQPAQDKRWVLVAPPGNPPGGATILLARASNEEQARFIGDQSGGRVFLFLQTDDFWRDYQRLLDKACGSSANRWKPIMARSRSSSIFMATNGI